MPDEKNTLVNQDKDMHPDAPPAPKDHYKAIGSMPAQPEPKRNEEPSESSGETEMNDAGEERSVEEKPENPENSTDEATFMKTVKTKRRTKKKV